ncbi:MAG: phosphatase PAP2 family protein, partial [Candidatus Udaeobacter sp.]
SLDIAGKISTKNPPYPTKAEFRQCDRRADFCRLCNRARRIVSGLRSNRQQLAMRFLRREDSWIGVSNQRFEKQRQFLQNRLSPEGYAGLHLTIGVLVFLLAGWWFGAIAENLSPDNPLVLFDQRVAVWFHQHATTTLTHVAKAITFFGSVLGLTILSVAVALIFIVSRAWFNLFVFAVMMTGESLLNVLLKHLFHRHRPVLEHPLVTLTSYGFPSGHTMGVTVLFGLLALFLAKTVSTAGAAFAYFIAAGLVILLIGLTRVYLGAHFLSDVLGAFAASVVWLTFCWTAFETLRRRQKHRPE